ncbi:MAG: iron uptake porin [Prochlorothrix sp.]
MTKLFWKSLVVTPVILGTALFASSASAQELSDSETLSQINEYTSVESDMGQLRSVNQLSDVRPTDWAYQAVRSLVERYNCVAGYPDGTFRGSRAMTRYEAAALVNACMDTVNDLIAAATADLVTKEDLAVLQRLQEEFQAELATLRGRVDSLEARTAELEANQFSTTTKLGGGALFSFNDAFGDGTDGRNTVFGGRVRLNLDSSFTGEDLLRTRLQGKNIGNSTSFSTGALEYSGNTSTSGTNQPNVQLDALWYRFPVGEKAEVTVGPLGVGFASFVPTTVWSSSGLTDYFDSGAAYESNSDEAGIGGNYQINEYFNIAAGYAADRPAGDPAVGVFNGDFTAGAQLTGETGKFTGALAYTYDYNPNSNIWDGVGTTASGSPFGTNPSGTSALNALVSYQFSPKFIFQSYFSHAWSDDKLTSADAKALSAGIGAVFPDAFIDGNEAGISVGIPPYVYDNDTVANEDDSVPIAVDMYYDFKVSDNIFIAPSVLLLFNADGGNTGVEDNFTAVTAIKTRFRF